MITQTITPNKLAELFKINPATARRIMKEEIGLIKGMGQLHVTDQAVGAWLSEKLGIPYESKDLELYGTDQVRNIVQCSQKTARMIISGNGGFLMRRRSRIPKIFFEKFLTEGSYRKVVFDQKTDSLGQRSLSRSLS